MIERIRLIRQECLERLTSLVECLGKTLTPETEKTNDLRRQIRKLKKYSQDVERSNTKFVIEDIDEATKETSKKEAKNAMRAADLLLFPRDLKMDSHGFSR